MPDRLTDLRAKLRSRTGKAGMEKNCDALRAEIARLEESQAAPAPKRTRKAKTDG